MVMEGHEAAVPVQPPVKRQACLDSQVALVVPAQ
jgi:hypothetical protein